VISTIDEIKSLSIETLISIAEQLAAEGNRHAAIEFYQTWLEHSPSSAKYVVYFNLGVLFGSENNRQRAREMYEKAVTLNPDLIQARLNLGSSLEQLGLVDEALEQWRTALRSKLMEHPSSRPLKLHALNNLGRLLENQRQYGPALEMLEKSLAIEPTQIDVVLHMVFLTQKICRWPLYSQHKGTRKEDLVKGTSPLAMLAASDDPEQQLNAAKRFVEHKFNVPASPPLAPAGGYAHNKTRIGYLSSDLSMHAVSLLTVELFERHDRARFEVYGFCWSREDGTIFRQRVINGFDHFIRIGELSDQEAAESIRQHEIDILVDLQGLTAGARPVILSYRPAPLQLSYLGFPGTSGLPWVDYIIADRYLIPDEEIRHYSEKPLYMPACFQTSDSKREVGPLPKRSDYSLPEDVIVFCSFNNNYKYTPEMFATWMRILKRVPNSVLWLLADNEWAKENLLAVAKKAGIKKDRLIFAPRVAPADYLARYQLADLFLDTYPFNGGTTANDALFMGLPLLTLSGRTFASRMAGSLLSNLGLSELITTDCNEYEKKAVMLANNQSELRRIREKLQENKEKSIVFDMERLTRDMETILLAALQSNAQHADPGAPAPMQHIVTTQIRSHKPACVPYFSVVIPTHNRPLLLERSLGSIRSQTFKDVEIIVVSDSADIATFQAAGGLLSERDVFIKRRGGSPGPAESRNIGIAQATGQYLIFLDDDDSFDTGYLEKLYAECEKNSGQVMFCNFHVIQEDREFTPIQTISETFIDIGVFPQAQLQIKNYIPNNALVYPLAGIDGKRFDSHLKLNEDWDFLLNVLEDNELRFIDISGPRIHKDDPKRQNRRGTRSHDYAIIDAIHVYRRWPAKTSEIKLLRQQLLQQSGTNVPLEWL
jgi:predicted O-linked N-acetylglucosamine transferase (SPINDLY family)